MSAGPAAPRGWKATALAVALAVPRLLIAASSDPPATAAQGALQACANITADADRLACYDRLAAPAARNPAPPPPAAAVTPPPAVTPPATAAASAAAAPAAAAPAALAPPAKAATAVAPPAAVTSASTTAPATAAAVGAAAVGAAAAAPLPSSSFGLYAAEHPKPAVATALESAVVALGKAPSGRMTVELDGGAWWELEEADPLLAVGDSITITRASLGSYLMRTPSQRTHRVRRLR